MFTFPFRAFRKQSGDEWLPGYRGISILRTNAPPTAPGLAGCGAENAYLTGEKTARKGDPPEESFYASVNLNDMPRNCSDAIYEIPANVTDYDSNIPSQRLPTSPPPSSRDRREETVYTDMDQSAKRSKFPKWKIGKFTKVPKSSTSGGVSVSASNVKFPDAPKTTPSGDGDRKLYYNIPCTGVNDDAIYTLAGLNLDEAAEGGEVVPSVKATPGDETVYYNASDAVKINDCQEILSLNPKLKS